MGNYYRAWCMDCRVTFFLGKENEWCGDHEKMYCFRTFMLQHTNHNLKVGGDEWNCAYDAKGRNLVDVIGYGQFEDKYAKLDYADHIKRMERNR